MKRAVVAIVVVLLGLSCLVDRKSGDYECDDDADCAGLDGSRECTNGYCLPMTCPSVCDDCDSGKVCNIECRQPNECRTGVACPTGYNCVFTCDQDCTPVTCVGAASCVVNCDTGADCGPIVCGSASPCTCNPSGGVCL